MNPDWEAPLWLRIEIGVYAGRLYFDFEEYNIYNDDDDDAFDYFDDAQLQLEDDSSSKDDQAASHQVDAHKKQAIGVRLPKSSTSSWVRQSFGGEILFACKTTILVEISVWWVRWTWDEIHA